MGVLEVELKLTKKKPIPGMDLSTGKGYYKYLYTDTGEVGRFGFAMKIAIPPKEKPPKIFKVKVELEKGEKDDDKS